MGVGRYARRVPASLPLLALYLHRTRSRSTRVPSSPLPSRRTERHERAYRPRILAALAVSLGVLVLAFRFWPVEQRATKRIYVAAPQERVPIELIEPTRQTPRAAPPPPPTLPPVEVPDDVPIPEEESEFEVLETAPSLDVALPEAPPGPEMDGPDEAPPAFVARADRRPQTISPVLPTYPAEAERHGIRARVRLRLRIGGELHLPLVPPRPQHTLQPLEHTGLVIDEQHGISGAQPSELFLRALRQLGPQAEAGQGEKLAAT